MLKSCVWERFSVERLRVGLRFLFTRNKSCLGMDSN